MTKLFPPPRRHWRLLWLGLLAGGVMVGGAWRDRMARETASITPAARTPSGTAVVHHRLRATAFRPGGGAESQAGPAPAEWLIRWQKLETLAPSPEREMALIAAVEDLAAKDPSRALKLAGAESDPSLRERLLQAGLRVWAARAPEEAARWAFALPEEERAPAMAAVLTGAARQTDEAVRLACRLCQYDPVRACDYGEALISALSQKGEDEAAVRFALAAAPADAGEERIKWLQTAFADWAGREPELAALASLQLPDDGTRFEALMAVIPHWVQMDPAGAAEVMRELPEEMDRRNLMGETLRRWVTHDPVGAATWLSRLGPQPMLDAGTAVLASLPSLVAGRPEVAVGWAENIIDPRLRSRTLAEILQQWASSDPAAARNYLAHSAMVLDDDRAAIDQGG